MGHCEFSKGLLSMTEGDTDVIPPRKLPPIGSGSTITLGFLAVIVAALLTLVGLAVGAIFWAGSLQTKVDFLVASQAARDLSEDASRKEVSELKLRVAVLEAHAKKP